MQNVKTGSLTVSACMIVKNEEDNLKRCLSSLAGFVDEIIIVDTGSTDKSVEIATSFGAKIFHHPWEDDFSKHRNQSIGYATSDWIFIIDADEELALKEVKPEKVKESLAVIPENIHAASMVFFDIQKDSNALEFNTTRFFRNGRIRYEEIVHNQPTIDGENVSVFIPGICLYHYGYDLAPEKLAEKTRRTVRLLHKRIKNNPKDYIALFYLNQTHAINNNIAEAIRFGEEYIKHKEELRASGVGNFNQSIYFTIVKLYMRLHNMEKAGHYLTEGFLEIPGDIDLSLALVEYGIATGRLDVVIAGCMQFENAFEQLKKDPFLKGNRFIYCNNDISRSYCLFQVIQSHFTLGLNAINKLKSSLELTSPMFRDGMLADLKIMLDSFELDKVSEKAVNVSKLTNIMPELLTELKESHKDLFKDL